MKPTTRLEIFLAKLAGEDVELPLPATRIEQYLSIAAGENDPFPVPITRTEFYLAKICGGDYEIPEPVTRKEIYLAALAGMEIEVPAPVTREEWFLAQWYENGGGEIVTVTGVSPLALLNALAHPIHSLTQYGLCTQDGTPTPDSPVDIVCNNGTLRYGAMGNNIYDPSTAVFEVGYYYNPNADGAQTAAQNNFIYFSYIPIEAGEAYVFYGRRKDDNRLSQYNRIHWYDAEKTYISTNTYVGGTIGKGVAPDNAVYARLSCNPQGLNTAISEETVLGYNWTFCKGTAEVTPFVPYVGGVKPVGTPEVLTVGGQNLVDLTAVTDDYYYDPSGVYTAVSNARLTDFIPVAAGQKYTVYVKAAQSGTAANVRCNLFDSAKIWKSQSSFTVTSGAEKVNTITPTENGYLRVSANYTGTGARVDWSTLQIVRGEYTLATMPPYEPYVTPQTVSVPMLLGLGDYKDEAELISGLLTHKIGIYVFTGEEAFTKGAAFYTSNTAFLPSKAGSITPICTHFQGISSSATRVADSLTMTVNGPTSGQFRGCVYFYADRSLYETAEDFKAWLAAQYAAGTPVIVLYPLATETTEQIVPHSLVTYKGTNVVDSVANVEPVELAVEYAASGTA